MGDDNIAFNDHDCPNRDEPGPPHRRWVDVGTWGESAPSEYDQKRTHERKQPRYTGLNPKPVMFDWPHEADDIVRSGWEAGRSAREIAAQLSDKYGGIITKNAVIGRARRLNLPKRQQGFVKEKRMIAAKPHYVPAPPPAKPPRKESVCNPFDRAPLIDIPPSESFAPVAAHYPYRKTLLELTNTSCRWPLGEPGTDEFFFCGAPEADCDKWRPYCTHHAAIAARGIAYNPKGISRFRFGFKDVALHNQASHDWLDTRDVK